MGSLFSSILGSKDSSQQTQKQTEDPAYPITSQQAPPKGVLPVGTSKENEDKQRQAERDQEIAATNNAVQQQEKEKDASENAKGKDDQKKVEGDNQSGAMQQQKTNAEKEAEEAAKKAAVEAAQAAAKAAADRLEQEKKEAEERKKEQDEKQRKEEEERLKKLEEEKKEAERKAAEAAAAEAAKLAAICRMDTALVLSAILYNANVNRNANSTTYGADIKAFLAKVSLKVFMLLCKVPQLLPIIWPVGLGDDEYHTYVQKPDASVDATKYYEFLFGNGGATMTKYINQKLKPLLQKVLYFNCVANPVCKLAREEVNLRKSKELITKVEGLKDDAALVKLMRDFTNDYDQMILKMFPTVIDKGVCAKDVRLLPKNYPPICIRYEMYEAILMIVNTIINNIGRARKLNGSDVGVIGTGTKKVKVEKKYSDMTTEEREKHAKEPRADDIVVSWEEEQPDVKSDKIEVNGGLCFKFNENWNKYWGDNAKKMEDWDGSSFKVIEENKVTEEAVTGKADFKDWMLNPGSHNETEVYYKNGTSEVAKNNGGATGVTKFVNPTKKYTTLFLLDDDQAYDLANFTMPLLSAEMTENAKKSLILDLYKGIIDDKWKECNPSALYNKNIMCSTMIATMKHESLRGGLSAQVSAFVSYIYNILIVDMTKWKLMFPMNTTMSFGSINQRLMEIGNVDGNTQLPQYQWCRNDKIINVRADTKLTELREGTQQVLTESVFDGRVIDVNPKQ